MKIVKAAFWIFLFTSSNALLGQTNKNYFNKLNLVNSTFHQDITEEDSLKQRSNQEKPYDKLFILDFDKSIETSFKDNITSCVSIQIKDGHGSGFFISKDGYIITNQHVVQDEDSVEVIVNSNKTHRALVLRTSKKYDLALLKIDTTGVKQMILSNIKPSLGSKVFIIGTPSSLDLGQTVTKGIVSGHKYVDSINFIISDAVANPGNSGGPMLLNGKVIGVVSRKLVRLGVEKVSFIIPISYLSTALQLFNKEDAP